MEEVLQIKNSVGREAKKGLKQVAYIQDNALLHVHP